MEVRMEGLGAALIGEVRSRLVKGFPEQLRICVEVLAEGQLWSRPDATSNSVGNLVLHLCGSTRHFLGRGVGGSGYRRDREAEFAERGPVPRADLLRLLDGTVAESDRILDGLAPERLMETTDRAGDTFTVLALLLRMSHHWAVHTGQAVFATKALRPGEFEERWKRRMA
jgi:uncharacterized damage-inducible protein DinB